MRAIVQTDTGSPDVLQLTEVPDPVPGPDDLLVDVAHAGVNFIDTYRRSGQYPIDLPHTPGTEGAGTVAAVGANVTGWSAGDPVAYAAGPGAYAEKAIVPAAVALPVPDGLSLDVAAALPLQGMTAHYLVDGASHVTDGSTVLLTAAAGGVGLLVTQLASARGARVLALVGAPEKEELARAAGAAEAIRYRELDDLSAELPALVRELTDGRGVDISLDGVGKDTFDASLASLRTRGTLVLFGAASGPVPPFDLQRLNSAGSVFVTRPSIGHYTSDREERRWRWQSVAEPASRGDLDVRIGHRFPLAQAADAHRAIESGTTTGKILLDVA
ncbi:quinone oxidoreductase family protein [Georgenia sp. Z1491]|uniref:quinone oxidoreductase family protein n=1 Tax=Georgenia sp. Z1491 TaxID=3416707 RepID=UPI003CF4F354